MFFTGFAIRASYDESKMNFHSSHLFVFWDLLAASDASR
jgi:hypothetical protein